MRKVLAALAVFLVAVVGLGTGLAACQHKTTAAAKPTPTTAAPTAQAATYGNGYAYGQSSAMQTSGGKMDAGEACLTDVAAVTGKSPNSASGAQWYNGCVAGMDDTINADNGSTPAPKPKPKPPVIRKVTPKPTAPTSPTVTFIVSGSSDAQVTYGPAGSNYQGSDPMRQTVNIPANTPEYYALSAQLQGGGQVECSIAVNGVVISTSTAQGGYNIADCEISPDEFGSGVDNTGWDADQ